MKNTYLIIALCCVLWFNCIAYRNNNRTAQLPIPTQAETTTVLITAGEPKKRRFSKAFYDSLTETQAIKVEDLGRFKVTVYVPDERWGYSTATGTKSKHLQTCAVDPNVIPLGTTIYVNGLELYCCDTGSAVKGNVIDIFYDGTDAEACAWGDEFGMWHDAYKVVG